MPKKSGEAMIDIIVRFLVYFSPAEIFGFKLAIMGIPLSIFGLSQIISVQLLPLSAFPKLETAATWLLWIFIGLMFAGAGWKQMLLMLAIGGVAMGFLSSLGVFAVADSEIAASYNDLVQNSKVKNQTASGVSNVWLMLSNPRLWYETQYGYKNDTLAQGDQTSPFALEITKAEVLEKNAPQGGEVTFVIRLENRGKREAKLVKLETKVGTANGVGRWTTENLGNYDRYTKTQMASCTNTLLGKGESSVGGGDTSAECLKEKDPDGSYLYFESTPTVEAHYTFCDNPPNPTEAEQPKVTTPIFEDGSIDEVFGTFKSPLCYGKHKVTAELTYSYGVTGTYNLELINPEYFTELVKYKKLKTHIEDSKSTEGPLKLTIRSVPEEQPVRLDSSKKEITVFYSLNNVGPGTAVIKDIKNIYLEGLDKELAISSDCNFETKRLCLGETDASKLECANLNSIAVKNFRKTPMNDFGVADCTFDNPADPTNTNKNCLTFSPDDPNSVVLLKCKFTYDTAKSFDTTKTLFMKMHVNYDYITSRTAQYETTPMPGYHSCVTKRELDGFANKTDMDLYLKTLFKDATIGNAEDVTKIKAFLDTSAGTLGNKLDLCVKDA